jgi:hypothetical protein
MPSKFESEITEPEEKPQVVDVQAESIVNPLDEPVNEKSYTNANVNVEGADFTKPIDEPRFTPPPFQKRNPQEEKKNQEPVNPEMKNLSKKETALATQQMAKLILSGYEMLHGFANKAVQISEKKLNKLQADGEINLNAMVEYSYGQRIRAGDFFQEYNNQAGNLFSVSDEFKEEVTPVLERVLAKRGIGITDENLLVILFAQDLAVKGGLFFQQKQTLNLMIESIKQATTAQFTYSAPPPPPPPPPPQQTPPPPPPPPQQGQKPDVIVMPRAKDGTKRGRPRNN